MREYLLTLLLTVINDILDNISSQTVTLPIAQLFAPVITMTRFNNVRLRTGIRLHEFRHGISLVLQCQITLFYW